MSPEHPVSLKPSMFLRMLGAALAGGIGLGCAVVGLAPAYAATPGQPVRLAIAVPITVPESSGALIDAAALAQYTSPLGTLTRQLDAVIDRPVALGIDPRIVVSIRLLGSSAPENATAWLTRLLGASNDTFPLTYADSDITLATQAGSVSVIGPDDFDFAINPALFAAPGVAVTPSPAPTAGLTPTGDPTSTTDPAIPTTPAIPPLPTSADLMAWPFSLTDIAWPLDATATASDLSVITGSGFTTTILSTGNLRRSDPGAGAIADVNGARVLVSDDPASQALRTATSATTAADWPTRSWPRKRSST